MQGIMKQDVELIGTLMVLKKGEKVNLGPVNNLPFPENQGYYATPTDGRYAHSILIDAFDVNIIQVSRSWRTI